MLQDLFNWFLIIIGILGLILIIANYLLVENVKMDENNGNSIDYLEKSNPFECGFDTFRQSNNPVPIPFILIALLFLPFDLEVSSMLPYIVSTYSITIHGLIIFYIFLFILIIGFVFELYKEALSLTTYISKNNNNINNNNNNNIIII